jgi:hypothetical protein
MTSPRHAGPPLWRRRTAVATMVLGAATLGSGVAGLAAAQASGAAVGSGLGAVDVTATASGVRAPMYSNSGEDVAGEVPWATSSMQTGGVTHSLTSVYWPGDTGGHGGDTLYLLGTPCIVPNPAGVLPVQPPCVYQPPQPPPSTYQPLNDPYKAEAQSGRGKGADDNGGQGVTMRAVAHDIDASATTTMDGSIAPSSGSQFGKTTVTTNVREVGSNTVVIDATSVLHNVSLGGGAITIDSVSSVAHAVSNTAQATGTAHTTINGMKIAGVPVTVDQNGVHVAGQGGPLPPVDQLNQALAQSGFQVFVAKPSKQVKGAAITLDSGSLVLLQTNSQYVHNANDTSRMLVLGGAALQANTGKGFGGLGNISIPPPPASSTGTTGTPGTAGTPGTPGTPGTAAVTETGTSPVVAGTPSLAAHSSPLPGGIPAGWVVLTVLGAALVAVGLRRLPSEVLTSTGPSCALRGQS